jgi:hypothetical protein
LNDGRRYLVQESSQCKHPVQLRRHRQPNQQGSRGHHLPQHHRAHQQQAEPDPGCAGHGQDRSMTDITSNSSRESFPEKNLAHVASLKGQLVDFKHRCASDIFVDCDDLGPFSAAKFVIPDGFEFWMYKYEATSTETVEVFFESQLPNWEVRLSDVLNFLEISSDALVWKNAGYCNTP